MLTADQKARLEALRKKLTDNDITADEKAELEKLTALAAEGDGGEKTYSEAYVKTLREEAAKYRTQLKEKDANLAKFDGIDPEEVRKLKEAQEKAEREKLKAEGKTEELLKRQAEKHAEELQRLEGEKTALAQQIEKLNGEINTTMLDNEIGVAAAAAQANNPRVIGLIVKNACRVDVDQETGARIIRVIGDDGKPRYDLKTGKPMTVAQYIEELKMDDGFAHEFAGGKPGAGSGTFNFQGAHHKNPWKKGPEFNLTLQGKISRENPQLAARLKQEAGA